MADIRIVIGQNVKRNRIFIDPKKSPADTLIKSADGTVIGSKEADNILGINVPSREIYGRI